MKRAIVIGSGAGGATVAKELQGKFAVTVLEQGKEFHPFSLDLSAIERGKKTGLLMDEREMSLFFRPLKIYKSSDMVLVKGVGLGGTTTMSTGNAIRKLSLDSRLIPWHIVAETGPKSTLVEFGEVLESPEFRDKLEAHHSEIDRHFEQVKERTRQATNHMIQASIYALL